MKCQEKVSGRKSAKCGAQVDACNLPETAKSRCGPAGYTGCMGLRPSQSPHPPDTEQENKPERDQSGKSEENCH